MRQVVAVLVLVLSSGFGLGQEGKLLWSNKEAGPGQVLAVSPNGNSFFTAHQLYGTEEQHRPAICRWELATGKLLHKYELSEVGKKTYQGTQRLEYLVEMSATPDAKTLLVSWETRRTRGAYSHCRLQRFDLQTGERLGEPIDDLSSHPNALMAERGYGAVSPDGRWFWAHKGGALEQLDVHSCETGKVMLTFKIEKDMQGTSLAFTEDGSKGVVFLHNCRGGQDAVRVCSMPDGQTLKEFSLPAGKAWTAVHIGAGGRMLVEATEGDQAQPAPGTAPIAMPMALNRRRYFSFDPSVAEPASTLRAEPLLKGDHGAGPHQPRVCCDAGTHWVAYFSDPDQSPDVLQAAFQEKGLRWWRSVKVIDRGTGKTLAEHKVVPASCFVTRDGRYLVACDPVPETKAGVFVWRLRE